MTQMHPAYGLGAMPSEAMSGVVLQVAQGQGLTRIQSKGPPWEVLCCVDKTPGCSVMHVWVQLQSLTQGSPWEMWSVVMLVSLMKAQGQSLTRIPSQGSPCEVLCCVDKTPG